MLKLLCISAGTFAASLLLSSTFTLAAENVFIATDQTQLIDIAGSPGTVVVGNPSIADATVHGDKLFVHGRAFGTTNMIILDQAGEEIASLEVTVKIGGSNNVAIFKAATRYSYVCAPLCEVALQPGDDFAFSGSVLSVGQGKSGFAKGEAPASGAAAPTQQ